MVRTIKFSLKIVLNTVLYSNKYTFSQNYFLNVYFTAEAAICKNCQTNCWKNLGFMVEFICCKNCCSKSSLLLKTILTTDISIEFPRLLKIIYFVIHSYGSLQNTEVWEKLTKYHLKRCGNCIVLGFL